MKLTLQLGVSQQLIMSPQMQQAIRLLRLSAVEIQEEAQKLLESNPMLESMEFTESETPELSNDTNPVANISAESNHSSSTSTMSDKDSEQIKMDMNMEAGNTNNYARHSASQDRNFQGLLSAAPETLKQHICAQLTPSRLTKLDPLAVMTIVDAIDHNGYLREDFEQLCWEAGSENKAQLRIEDLKPALDLIQTLDPPGIGAGNLVECLLIQLDQLANHTSWRKEAKTLLSKYSQLLETGQYTKIASHMGLKQTELSQVLALIQSLNPRPGSAWCDVSANYVEPDLFVYKEAGAWIVKLNSNIQPSLRINSTYAGMIWRGDRSQDSTFLRTQLKEARWFLNSLKNRNRSLLSVGQAIVSYQEAFLEKGELAMQPLILRTLAEELDLNESTVSRLTNNKYISTPRGTYELKYFFSSNIGASDGSQISSTAIQAMIRDMISTENPSRPLSDSKVTARLAESGINIARRTVAKYREVQNIPTSSKRRQFTQPGKLSL